MLQGLLKSCVYNCFPCFVFYRQRVILCLIAPKWQIMPVMIWWKCEIIKLLRRPAACVYSFVFAVTNLCHEASRGQAVIYTNSLPQPFLDLGVITWEQNGFISFNPAAAAICTGNICSCGVCTVKQLETSESLKYKQGGGGNNQNKIRVSSNWKWMFWDEMCFKFCNIICINLTYCILDIKYAEESKCSPIYIFLIF